MHDKNQQSDLLIFLCLMLLGGLLVFLAKIAIVTTVAAIVLKLFGAF
jgi:hypothetical protein